MGPPQLQLDGGVRATHFWVGSADSLAPHPLPEGFWIVVSPTAQVEGLVEFPGLLHPFCTRMESMQRAVYAHFLL